MSQLILPADAAYDAAGAPAWAFGYDPVRARLVGRLVARAFLPIPDPRLPVFWGSNWLESIPGFGWIQLVAAVALAGWCALGLRGRPGVLCAYVSGTLGLLIFFYCVSSGSIRHHGFLFLVFFAVLWTHGSFDVKAGRGGSEGPYRWWLRTSVPVTTVILSAHVLGGLVATRMEWLRTFSNAQPASSYITSHGLSRLPMVGSDDYAASAVVGYLGVPAMRYPRGKRSGSFVVWDRGRVNEVSLDDVLLDAQVMQTTTGKPVLLVLNRPLTTDHLVREPVVELARFTGAVMGDEDYYLYRLQR